MMELQVRLTNNQTVIMDGGVSTEMERKGLAMDGSVWSGTAHVIHPDIVREVHEDYIRAGAEVITANTFACAPHVLASVGKDDDAAQINRDGIALAKQARDNAATGDVWIAGFHVPACRRSREFRERPSVRGCVTATACRLRHWRKRAAI